jgi:hypothetical protein
VEKEKKLEKEMLTKQRDKEDKIGALSVSCGGNSKSVCSVQSKREIKEEVQREEYK